MKKLFISCPMRGRSALNIKNSMEEMKYIASNVFKEEFEVIDSYIEEMPPKDANEQFWYLQKSLELLQNADYFIGVGNKTSISYGYKENYTSCQIEGMVALDILHKECCFIDPALYRSFKDIVIF